MYLIFDCIESEQENSDEGIQCLLGNIPSWTWVYDLDRRGSEPNIVTIKGTFHETICCLKHKGLFLTGSLRPGHKK